MDKTRAALAATLPATIALLATIGRHSTWLAIILGVIIVIDAIALALTSWKDNPNA